MNAVVRRAPWLAVLLAVFVLAAFSPALSGEFLNLDDDRLFAHNRAWRGLSPEHWRWMASTAALSHYYPLTWATFGIDHALWGFTPPAGAREAAGYHLTSVLLHAGAAVALFLTARKLFALAAPRWTEHARVLAAAAAAFAWAVHPLRAESVVWLTERSDVLSTLLLLLATRAWLAWAGANPVSKPSSVSAVATLACSGAGTLSLVASLDLSHSGVVAIDSVGLFVAGVAAVLASVLLAPRIDPASSRPRTYALAWLLLLLSLLSKAWGVALPAVLLLIDAWPLRRWSWRRALALVAEKSPFIALAVVFARLASFAQRSGGADLVASWDEHTLTERIAQAAYGLTYYPVKTLVPMRLLPIHELPERLTLTEARWLVPLLAVVAVSLVAVAACKRAPAVLAAWVAFALLVGPVLGFAQSGPQLVADRYSYLAGIPFALLAGAALVLVFERTPRAAATIAVVLASLLGIATWRQAAVWSTSDKLWTRAHELAPESPFVLMSLGTVRSNAAGAERDPARARALLEEALVLHTRASELSSDALILRNVSQVHTSLSRADPERADEHQRIALEFSRRALELARSKGAFEPEYLLDYGTDLVNAGRIDEGVEHLRAYVAERPERLRGWMNLGVALVMAEETEDGLRHLHHACELEPNDARPWEMLAGTCDALERIDEALRAWRRVLTLDPQHPRAKERIAELGAGAARQGR